MIEIVKEIMIVVIGGFGIYDIDGFEDVEWVLVEIFWGVLFD